MNAISRLALCFAIALVPALSHATIPNVITFKTPANHKVGDAPFTVNASASSGLAVTVDSANVAICTVSGKTVTVKAEGMCGLRAMQNGDANTFAAVAVIQSFRVYPAVGIAQRIIFVSIPAKVLGSAPFAVTVLGGTSGNPVRVGSFTKSICTVNGFVVTMLQAGICSLQANQDGNAQYAAAAPVNQDFTISGPTVSPVSPVVTPPGPPVVPPAASGSSTPGTPAATPAASAARLFAESANFSAMWWNPQQSGMGVSIEHQGNTLFALLFIYDANGQAAWYVASDLALQDDGTFDGLLYRATGPQFGAGEYDAKQVALTSVGMMSISFSSAEAGSISYAVNGVAANSNVVKLVFGAPKAR